MTTLVGRRLPVGGRGRRRRFLGLATVEHDSSGDPAQSGRVDRWVVAMGKGGPISSMRMQRVWRWQERREERRRADDGRGPVYKIAGWSELELYGVPRSRTARLLGTVMDKAGSWSDGLKWRSESWILLGTGDGDYGRYFSTSIKIMDRVCWILGKKYHDQEIAGLFILRGDTRRTWLETCCSAHSR